MLLALDGEDSPYLTENCLLKDTDTPVAEQVQKLFVWIKTTWRRRNPQNLNKI